MPEITDATPVTAAELDEWQTHGAAWMTEQMHVRLIAEVRRLREENERLTRNFLKLQPTNGR